MEADYSGGQSSPWAVAPRGRKKYSTNNIQNHVEIDVLTAVNIRCSPLAVVKQAPILQLQIMRYV
jgi:hypothetical protein